MKEQFEQMSLSELSETLRDGLGVLYTKLREELGYGDFTQITGTLDSSFPDVYIINTSGINCSGEINHNEMIKL